jgi:type IV pilus assembly protein PilA
VTEGLNLADGWKTGISEYYALNGSFPASSSSAGGAGTIAVSGASVGKYVGAIAVTTGGDIIVTYGGSQANSKLSGLKLGLYPGLDTNNDVIWVCGTAATPTGVSSVTITTTTTVPAAYLPNACHA